MEPVTIYRMAARLSSVNSLYFPITLLHIASSLSRRKTALLLHPYKLAFFDMLRDDYGVCSHLNRLRALRLLERRFPSCVPHLLA